VADGLHVPREALDLPETRSRRHGPESRPEGGNRPPAKAPVERADRGHSPRGIVPPEVQDERYVLLHALAEERWLEEAREQVAPAFFQVEPYADAFRRLAEGEPSRAAERLLASDDASVLRVLAELEVWREEQGFPLSDEAFRDSVRGLQIKAVERGLLPELRPTGEPLADAVERSRFRRDIHRGRHRPAGSPE
jgi:hypothetical protein